MLFLLCAGRVGWESYPELNAVAACVVCSLAYEAGIRFVIVCVRVLVSSVICTHVQYFFVFWHHLGVQCIQQGKACTQRCLSQCAIP